jgi:Flp pilus assembly pilin Flp
VKSLLNRVWREDQGVLTFEWILLITVLVIGVVGGLSAVRDAVITELGDVAQAVVSLDQSYYILAPWEIAVADCMQDGAEGSRYDDAAVIGENRGGIGPQAISACTVIPTGAPQGLPDSF